MDDSLTLKCAVLQANLALLQKQSDILSDFSDMQAIRRYRAELEKFIATQAHVGTIPSDPLSEVTQRLECLGDFFEAAEHIWQLILDWKSDWLSDVPSVSLNDLEMAAIETGYLLSGIPDRISELSVMLDPRDWAVHANGMDLHEDLQICAVSLNIEKVPRSEALRVELRALADGSRERLEQAENHLHAVLQRITELIELHEEHRTLLVQVADHLSRYDFHKAESVFSKMCNERYGIYAERFSDIDYFAVETELENQSNILNRFVKFDSTIDERLGKSPNFLSIQNEINALSSITVIPNSDLGMVCSQYLSTFHSKFKIAHDKHIADVKVFRKKREVKIISAIIAIILIMVFTVLGIHLNLNAQKKQRNLVERKVAQAKAKAESAYIKLAGKRAGEEKVIEIAPGVIMTFCWIPAGKFTMGSPKYEHGRGNDEDQVEVTLSQGFWMAKTEVTQAQWHAVMGDNPSRYIGGNLPVESVTWNDTQKFLDNVNSFVGNSDGGKMVLPTEAQWEYACRAGETGPYSGGSIKEVAWYRENSGFKTHEVGGKKPNAWGLYDMHGNVAEWCEDIYASKLEGGIDPRGMSSGMSRVVRDGPYIHHAVHCRSAARQGKNRYDRNSFDVIGFRPARISEPLETSDSAANGTEQTK